MNITVYLGASDGNDKTFKRAIKELGTWIGISGNTLVYGGSKTGLMGKLADSVLNAGGKVIGVEAQMFVDEGVHMDNLTKLYIEKDIADRRTRMIELGDAFIAFPGATGTLEEISEILSKLSLYQLECPCIFYNVNGYYDHLKAFLQHMIDCELSTPKQQQNIYFLDSIDEIANKLKDE
mgnify:CR=1 FL=1